MANISNSVIGTKDCYGCGLCVSVCKKNVLNLRLNAYGFFEPDAVNIDACVNCGLCKEVCSFDKDTIVFSPFLSFAGWSNDMENRKSSSSGGVAYEISKAALEMEYSIICVRYNVQKGIAEHYIADNLDDLKQSRGSKYIQSYTVEALTKINRHRKYVFIGTPCQAASMRLFVEKFGISDNFIIVDFFCHGVPSYKLWKKYLEEHSGDLGCIKDISWRNKNKGWHSGYCITIKGDKSVYQSYRSHDDFYAFFLGDACLGKACYDNCRFKYDKSCADLRLGDFWGNEYLKNEKGVSSVVVFTQKGQDLLLSSDIELVRHSFEQVANGQMKTTAKRPWYYALCFNNLNNDKLSLQMMGRILRNYKLMTSYIQRIISILWKRKQHQ